MAFSNSTNHYEEEVSDERGDCVNRRLIQQRNVRELEGEFLERDSDQHTSSSEDEKHFQFNEQRGNKQRNNKSSHYGLERGSYESDSSELSDLSHDQDSWDYKKNNRKVRIDDKNCRTEFRYSGNSHQQSDRQIVLETVEENTKTFRENSVEEESLDQRRREENKYRRNKDNNGRKNHQSQRRLTFEDKSNSMEAPNVVITEAEVHVDHEEYRERRRKGRSDPHLHISHHGDPEEHTQRDNHSRTRSEPRRPIKHGKDEVNKAERHVHMIDNDRHRHVKQVHGSHKREDNDVDLEVQENKRGHRESNEQRENRNREELSANRNKRQDSGEEVELGRDQKADLRKGIRKMNSQKSESFESDSNKNEYLPSEGEQYRDRGHSEQVNMREERTRQGHSTRYYTPQLERRQNRRGKEELLSHVSEDDLSEAVIRDREHTRFAPVVKAKNMKDVKTVRNQYAEEDFSMPNNKLGSFQDFKPLAKTPSVSRISNTYDLTDDESTGMMMEESTVEIEPWEDYLTLEVGPVLKCMQYPSFDEDLSEGEVDQIQTEDEDETNTSYEGDSSSDELDFDIEDGGIIDDSDTFSQALEIEVKSADTRDKIAVIENSQGPDILDNELDNNDVTGLNQDPRESYERTSSGTVSSFSDVEEKGEQEVHGDEKIKNDKPNRTQSKDESLIGSAKRIQEDGEQPVSPGVINSGDRELCSYTNEIFALEQNDPFPAVNIVEGFIEDQDELESIMTGQVETAVKLGDVNKVEAATGHPRDNLVLEDTMVTQLELSNEERINFSSDQTGENIHKSTGSSLSSNIPEEDLIYSAETNDESQVYMKEKYVQTMQDESTISDHQNTAQESKHVIEQSSKGLLKVTEEDGTGEFRSNKNKDLYLEHQAVSKGDKESDQALSERQAKSAVSYKQHENALQQNQTDILQRQLEHSFPEKDHIYKTNYSRKKNKKVTDLSFPSVAKDKQHETCNFEKKLSYDYEREVSFETDVYGKKQNEKRSQGQFYSRTEPNDIYRHNNPHRRERKILNTVPETEIEHSRNIPSTNMTMSVKQHASASRQFQPIERGLSMRIDRDTLGDHNKTYVHMAGSSNYAKRHHKSQDALANIKSRRMKINRGDSQKRDGPLSLQDSHGAGMEPYDSNQSTQRALSQTSNHLSESSSSLANQVRGISQSPSKQSSIARQQSVQSEVNGEQREEGIKFERLKNLQEDDLLVKVEEIVGHLEKLEDYHRGDGMRIQKMLGDMYWDYTPIRETIGDCMADHGYAVVSMKMLKTLNGIGIFKNDDVWFPTYYTYNTMWNFTDASNKLAQALADNDAVRLLTLNCGHKPYINAIHSKNVYYVMKASLSILHNIARNSGMKHLFDENKTSETIMPFLESEDEMLKILATLTIANIVDEEENKTLITDTGTISCIEKWMEKALGLARRRYKGFTPQELTEGLNRLAVNDTNKMKIVDEGALPLFLKMLQHDDVREQSSAARIIWTLSFDKDVRQKIKDFPELVPILEKLTESTNKSLQNNASGALWVIRGDNDVTKESRPRSARSKTHVFLSYSWADKETVLSIRDKLRAEGYAIWIDIEKMGGSTLEGMAAAVENSAVVLVCMSEKYKQSPNCRTEAEYTFQLRKDYIPIMMQKKYRPDGWLGIILGAKLYFDFSGKYPLEKSFQGLIKELRGRGKVTPGHTPGDDQTDTTTGTMIHSQSLSSHASVTGTPTHQLPSNSPVLQMGQEELIKWLRNVKLTECIPAFMEFDGKLLMQLKVMREEAPEFFYQCLEKRLNMSLIEILKFTRALEDLH